VAQLSYVNWVGLYRPDYKVSPQLMGARAPAAGNELGARTVAADALQPQPGGNITIQAHRAEDVAKVAR
jgi:hypothetical protein